MNSLGALVLLAVAIIVILGLCFYAWSLRKEVSRREAYRRDEDARAQQNSLENLDYVAGALVQEQVDITEGAWRCKVLLEIIDPSLTERAEFKAFAEHYARTQHLKTHSSRQKLTARERMQEDKERIMAENDMREAVLEAARAVLKWRAEGRKSSH